MAEGREDVKHLRDEAEIREDQYVIEVEATSERTVRVGHGGVTCEHAL